METTKNKQQRMQKHRFYEVVPLNAEEVPAPQSLFHLVETMMQIDPQRRYQTPAQLLEAIREARRDLEGGKASSEHNLGTHTIFVVEANEKLQNAIRTSFKQLGFRVLLSAEPERALLRFQQHPFDALILDAGSTGEQGFRIFREILYEANRLKHPCGGVLMLSEDQAAWAEQLPASPNLTVLIRPIYMKNLHSAIGEVLKAKA
jgi:CheY-like chemotaxis protein